MDNSDLVQVTFTNGKVMKTRVSKYDANELTITFLDPDKIGMIGKDGKTYPMSEITSINKCLPDGGVDHHNIFNELKTHLRMTN